MQAGRARKAGAVVIGYDPLGATLGDPVTERAAERVAEWIEEPVRLVPVLGHGGVAGIEVVTPDASVLTDRAILSSGRHPHIPDAFVTHLGRTVFHHSDLAFRIRDFGSEMPVRWLVLGSGPEAADAANLLRGVRPDAVVDTAAAVERVTEAGGFYDVVFRDDADGRPRFLPVDAVLLATGYEQPRIPTLLAEFLPWLQRVDDGAMAVGGNDRVRLLESPRIEIFVIGYADGPPGIYETPFAAGAATRMERVLLSLPKRELELAD